MIIGNDYISLFNKTTGMYLRIGKNDIDPFMGEFPELLDIGIMGHCENWHLCRLAGIDCYQNSEYFTKENMNLNDYESIMKQCKGKTFQVALGGRGDPDCHEHFEDILKMTVKYGIVPNFTTSGLFMDKKKAALCKKHCGAVAVSWHNQSYTVHAISTLLKADVKTNIHYVLHKDNLDDAIERLETDYFPKVNAVIFLLYKPVGMGKIKKIISPDDKRLKTFFSLVDKKHPYKIGFDSCTVPGLINYSKNVSIDSIDTCEGGRWSAYISSDMKMMPCSFDNQTEKWSVDLRKYSIKEAWDSDVFDEFRSHLKHGCPGCPDNPVCMGGCPICPEIRLCNNISQFSDNI